MADERQYATAGAFRTALEARLNERARRDGVDLHRLRRQVAFDRLLARLFDASQHVRDGWVLKGGYALEMRFRKAFVNFHVDLGVGDEILEPLESVTGEDWLGFAGISAVVVPALSVEQHWAEKFHAYTRPRKMPNSRVRDLVDLLLILEHEEPATEAVRAAVNATFQRRGTHPVPDVVPEPPSGWARPFAALAAECGLEHTLPLAHRRAEAFWRSVRTGQ